MNKQWVAATIAGAVALVACAATPAQACVASGAGCYGYGFAAGDTGRYSSAPPYALQYAADYQTFYSSGRYGRDDRPASGGAPFGNVGNGTRYPAVPNDPMREPARLAPGAPQFPQVLPFEQDMRRADELRGGAGPKSDRPAEYVVRAGDTLYRIAQAYDTTVDMLMLENHIEDATLLQIGQKLTIPAARGDIAAWLKNQKGKVAKVLNATLTAYTAGFESTGKTPSHPAYGITSSGVKVKENHTIAVDPDVIPMGSLVYIEGIGIRQAEDTGSAIKGARIDVYIPDLEDALTFGVKKNVPVYVLSSGRNDVRVASSES